MNTGEVKADEIKASDVEISNAKVGTELDIKTITLNASGLAFSTLTCGKNEGNDEQSNDKNSQEVVICLHGFPDNNRSFRFQLPVLAKAGYYVIAPTMRGFEPSSQPDSEDYSLDALARDVMGWIDDLGVDKVHLIGHDWGAAVAYTAAALAPDRFHSITAIAVPHGGRMVTIGLRKLPSQLMKSWYMMFFQLRGVADMVVEHNDWALIKYLWRSWSPTFDLPAKEWGSLRGTFSLPGVKKAMLSYYRQNVPPSIMLGLKKGGMLALESVPVRTLAITGEIDGCIDTRLYDLVMLDKDFPEGLEVERIKNSGHFTHQENPDEVNALILNWFGRKD